MQQIEYMNKSSKYSMAETGDIPKEVTYGILKTTSKAKQSKRSAVKSETYYPT